MQLPERHPAASYGAGLPVSPLPIVIIGAGGIVKDAHLPAYRKAGFPVWGIVDPVLARAEALAREYGIEHVFSSTADAVRGAPESMVYDLALMPEHVADTLEALPNGAAVLIQKPLGHTLDQARVIRDLCVRKNLIAAVNTQLRFAPYVAEARRLIAENGIGELYDIEVRVQVSTPWEMFPSVFGLPRLEINMHSIHYVDLMRSFVGDPASVSAVTVRHPAKPDLATTRTTIIMRYPDRPLRVTVHTNHDHVFGPEQEQSFVKWEGTDGAIVAQLGLLLDYPEGGEDRLRLFRSSAPDAGWQDVPFSGSWFPDAFIGSMGALQRFVEGSVHDLPTSVDDVLKTMAVVEAAYESDAHEGVPLADDTAQD